MEKGRTSQAQTLEPQEAQWDHYHKCKANLSSLKGCHQMKLDTLQDPHSLLKLHLVTWKLNLTEYQLEEAMSDTERGGRNGPREMQQV